MRRILNHQHLSHPSSWLKSWQLWLLASASILGTLITPNFLVQAQPQPPAPGDGRALVVRSDRQEANSQNGIVTATGNVQIDYPARQIRATAAQAQYFSNEPRRIILSGNVYVLQNGNSIRGETITYLIDEGRFVAIPRGDRQVESTYLVNDPESPTTPVAPAATTPFNPKPEFKGPTSE